MSCSRSGCIGVIAACALGLAGVPAAMGQTIQWTGATNNSWHTAGNWSLNRVPQAGDDVVIPDMTPDVTITYSSGAVQINSLTSAEALNITSGVLTIAAPSTVTAALTLAGGTLDGAGSLAINGPLSWTGGTMGGSGLTTCTGGVALSGTAVKTLTRNMDCDSNMMLAGSGQFWIGDARLLRVLPGRTLELSSDAAISWTAARGTLRNEGTLRKVAAVGNTRIDVVVESPGDIEVNSGTIEFAWQGVVAGPAGGAGRLAFGAGAHTIAAAAVVTCPVLVSGGVTTVSGLLDVPALTMTAGTISFEGPEALVDNLIVSGGTMAGDGDMAVTSAMDWSGGTISGAGLLRLTGAGTWSGTAVKTLARDMEVSGSVTWTGSGQLWIGDARELAILPGASFNIQTDADISWSGARGTLRNAGLLRKSVAAGVTSVQVAVQNDATLEVASGRMNLGFDSVISGVVIGSGALAMGFGNHTVAPSASVSIAEYLVTAGAVSFNGALNVSTLTLSGGTLDLGASSAAGATSYTQSGGTLAGSGDLMVAGMMSWSGGTAQGDGTLYANGGIAVSGSAVKTLNRDLEHAGVGTWSGTGPLWIGNGATLVNQPGAVFEILNDATLDWSIQPRGTFDNRGTLRKTSAAGTTPVNIRLLNRGSVEIAAGTLSLNFGGTHSGSFGGGGRLAFGGDTHVVEAAASIAVRDMLFQGGASDIHGAYNLSGGGTSVAGGSHTIHADAALGSIGAALTISGGAIDFSSGEEVNVPAYTQTGGTLRGSDAVRVAGAVNWTGGTIDGSGTLFADGGLLLGGIVVKTLNRDLEHRGAGTWSGLGQFWIGNGATLVNHPGAVFEIQNDATLDWSIQPRGTFDNRGTLRKSGGVGVTPVNVTFSNAGVVEVDSGTLRLNFDFPNFVANTLSGGTYILSGAFQFQGANIVTNAATIVLDGSASAILSQTGGNGLANFAANAAAGSLTLTNGRNLAAPGAVSNAGALTIDSGCTLTTGGVFVQTGGTTTLNNSTLDPAGLADIQGGLLSGSGNVLAAVSNAGSIAPGLSPGVLTIAGDYSQAPNGRLLIEVAGIVPGAQFDVLEVSGAASLAGALDIAVADLSQPQPPEVYQFLNSATRSGAFSEVNAPCLNGGNRVLVAYRADGAELQIVNPLPADMNCDCGLDFFDIDPFVLALFSPAAYAGAFPNCDIQLGDVNADGAVNFFDIDPFVDLLLGQ